MSDIRLHRAALAIWRGGVIAYPTEAVFGLGCDPGDHLAILRILRIKARDAAKGFIIVGASVDQIDPFVRFPDPSVRDRVLASWPGPVTWVLPAATDLDPALTGGRRTIAVRVTAHPPTAALCGLVGALVSTSANRGGRPPIRENLRCRAVLGGMVDAIAPGEVGGLAGPTAIRDALTGAVLRAGPVPASTR
jgi:L-threonylcarbamoyladenylate synthase